MRQSANDLIIAAVQMRMPHQTPTNILNYLPIAPPITWPSLLLTSFNLFQVKLHFTVFFSRTDSGKVRNNLFVAQYVSITTVERCQYDMVRKLFYGPTVTCPG